MGPRPIAVCLVDSVRLGNLGAPVEISQTGPLAELLLPDRMEVRKIECARQCTVQSKAPELVGRVVNDSLQAVMLERARRPLYRPV